LPSVSSLEEIVIIAPEVDEKRYLISVTKRKA
jgi:hypothetical protein